MKELIAPQRLEDLHDVLEFCSEINDRSFGNVAVFTTGERIAINQERGSIYSQINKENLPHEVRTYKVSPDIEAKIKFTLNQIHK